jgi:hypothetical protein
MVSQSHLRRDRSVSRAAGFIRAASERAATADFDILTQAGTEEVVPAASTLLDAAQFWGETVVAEVELGRVAIGRAPPASPDPVARVHQAARPVTVVSASKSVSGCAFTRIVF